MKYCTLTIIALLLCALSFAQGPISGPSVVCNGNTITLTNSTLGGTWTSSTSVVATVGMATGVVTGVASGVTIITYTVGASFVTHPVTVNPSPPSITGPSSVCVGSSITLSSAAAGGTWSSSSVSIAPIGAATGVLTGVAAGTTVITYSLGTGCFTTKIVTVNPFPGPITGPSSICAGGTTATPIGASVVGGTFSISSVSIATIGGTSLISGVSPGTATITYTSPTGCTSTKSFTVTPAPAIYTMTGGSGGTASFCSGGSGVSFGLSGSDPGVSYVLWQSGVGTAIGPIIGTGSALSFGPVTSPGLYCIMAYPGTSCLTIMNDSITLSTSPLPTVYTLSFAGGSYCAGGSGSALSLSGSQAGVGYQLYIGGTPVGTPVPGTGSPLSFGTMTTATTYYVVATNTTTGCTSTTATATLTVHPLPVTYTVTGGGSYCAGGTGVTITLSGSVTGVDYQLYLSGTPVGSPVAGTGVPVSFSGITTAGTYTIVATNATTSCSAVMSGSAVVTITPTTTPSVSISASPGTTVCTGATVTFTATPTTAGSSPTYQWYKNGLPVATGTTYSVVPVTGDVVLAIVYSSDPCPTTVSATSSSLTMTVGLPTITTSSTYPCGGAQTVTAAGGVTYSWAPTTGLSCSACGITDATPATTTTYTVTGTDASGCTNTATLSVNANRIAGQLTYTGGSSTDVFKVWLIQFNPSDSSITALDSTTTCMLTGSVPYYEFVSPAAGSYLVKAKLNGTVAGTSGYIPTYGLSTPNWYAAASVSHTTARDNMNISMVYGTVPSGPGFISGYVVAGAGKGTAGDIAEPGMLIYLYNTSGSMITYTYTDAAGVYSFSGLATGTYYIYPEAHKYYTTPSATITLSGSSTSSVGIGFRKSTTLGTIKPYDNTQIMGVTTNATLAVYPVPTSRILYIEWPATTTAHTGIVVRDMKGATVYNTEVDPANTDFHSELDLNTLPDGIYHITIRSSDIFYTSKLMIIH